MERKKKIKIAIVVLAVLLCVSLLVLGCAAFIFFARRRLLQ